MARPQSDPTPHDGANFMERGALDATIGSANFVLGDINQSLDAQQMMSVTSAHSVLDHQRRNRQLNHCQ